MRGRSLKSNLKLHMLWQILDRVDHILLVGVLVLRDHTIGAGRMIQRVEADLQAEAGQRQLLTLVDPEDQDEDAVRAQLVDLHTRIYGRVTAPGAEEITDLFNLWSTSAAEGDAANGWKSVLTAMFQSPDAIFY